MSSITSLVYQNRPLDPPLNVGQLIEVRAVNSTTAQVQRAIKVKAVKTVATKALVDFKTSKCAQKDPKINPLIVSCFV